MACQSEHISSHKETLKSPVALDLPLSFSMLWRIRCDKSHSAVKGADLATRYCKRRFLPEKNPQTCKQTRKFPPVPIKSFTSHTGPVPQSTLQNTSLMLANADQGRNHDVAGEELNSYGCPFLFSLKPQPNLQRENWALLVTQQHNLFD